jgi:TolB-like protein
MRWYYLILAGTILPLAARAAPAGVAVCLYNDAGQAYALAAQDLGTALNRALAEIPALRLVETKRLEPSVSVLAADESSMTPNNAAVLGQAVGADAVLTARFSIASYRLRLRLINVGDGVEQAVLEVQGAEVEVFDMVDRLVEEMEAYTRADLTLAITPFENSAGRQYDGFVGGLADLLIHGLERDSLASSLASRAQTEAGRLSLDSTATGPLSQAEAVELGRWLGADIVATGVFEEIYQLESQLIDADTGVQLGHYRTFYSAAEMQETVEGLSRDLELELDQWHTPKVAVLYFENHAEAQYDGFVHGLADMLMTAMGQAGGLQLIERLQIDRAMTNFNVEMSGPIETSTAVEVGAWLGADGIVLGSFTKFGETYRLDARLIDARTGELLRAETQRGEASQVMALTDRLGARLASDFSAAAPEDTGVGTLQVRFQTSKSEMGERPVYYHICKLYVDGRYLETSQIVAEPGREYLLFSRELRAGTHDVRVVHGYVKDGAWDGEMPQQPRAFKMGIETGATENLRYTYEVGWFKNRYVY